MSSSANLKGERKAHLLCGLCIVEHITKQKKTEITQVTSVFLSIN
jgi:hypothetical protein